MAERVLLQAKCEDGEIINVSTEWGTPVSAREVIGTFMALGIKLGAELCGKNAHKVYKVFEEAFRELQNAEKVKEILETMKEENERGL